MQRKVSVVGQECLSKIGEFNPFRVLNVKVLHKSLYLLLCVVNLHMKQPCCELKLANVAFSICVKGSEGIHYIKVLATVIEMMLLTLYDFQTV